MIEVLMAVAVIVILTGIGIPFFREMQVRNDLDVAVNAASGGLRRAQMLSMSPQGDIAWGVKLQASSVVVFKGASFAGRDTNYDEQFDISPTIVVSGTTEFVFAKFTGLPTSTGTITLTSSDGDAKNISINAKGTLSY
ncbi:MAG: hypothetical protein A3B23_02980 [Candidatus Colwellbacteria bacterium RIFCSPLOWO2_01_FULL_48_10]|uniref:General secretion pathway GspH domain-containing protein n=2 Tax=Bacteria candidate phyla TaxID=1783234 RepID=A0A1F5P424_9BACT|nr:MAG: hypothetical protein A2846_02265 [Candidatus Doudnabacteria bacterium RIFCSPHIGHO2_01_FULL_49_9]OGY60017.1 MAG: hypothetical protein A3B23_02980 [Candidatus Colwellbacteria bacterium RIFCSPLOWO2_01_FULL_48_10]